MAAGDGKSPLISVWLNASTDLLRAKVNFGDLDTTEATVFSNWYLGSSGGAQTLVADPGTYTLTGSAATLTAARNFSADSGQYLLTGSAAALSVGRNLSAASGAYVLTGQTATLTRTYNLSANAGTFNLNGASATFLYSRVLRGDPGIYTIDGYAATLTAVTVFPSPSDVREGVVYGPGGIYTGTLVAGAGETSVAIRSFTRKF